MPIARGTECSMGGVGSMAAYRLRGLITGTTKVGAAPRKNVRGLTPTEASAHADKVIGEKTKKGYKEVKK